MYKLFIQFAALSGAIAVGLGAFGAHALKDRLTSSGYLDTYQTAVSYQFYHTVALLIIGVLAMRSPSNWINYSGYAMMVGMVLFSGSLYILCFSGIRWLGAITPVGGLAFISGWILLLVAALKSI